ncbi:FlgO family outer membrane protein [Pseudoalteromonas sp. T1lg23B]|uniref:FlgO family outer membrane protein n=1 Tax=Pseudoalteromonas sp. T1lg23B TaxID=2077097 RepID=UPI000CF5ED38|nr:FlgO family outer membrane protein [Pseudoalteromonas sp. T1lg23B]
MKNFLYILLLPLSVGCANMMSSWDTPTQQVTDESGQRSVKAPSTSKEAFQSRNAIPNTASQMANMSRKNINHYVRGIMQDMVENLQYVNAKTPLAVSSFVYLDDNYDQATLLGNQLSESFMHELHKFGVAVVDFKTTDYMRVTPDGDFVFSRDYLELNETQNFQYVLAGTLVNHQGGVLVNARIVGINSKAVVGSAQGFIPQSVVDALGNSYRTDGILLKKASN